MRSGVSAASREERRKLEAHWEDLAEQAYQGNRPRFTDFVPSEDWSIAKELAQSCGVTCVAFGGTENALRTVIGFFPEFIPADHGIFPIVCVTIHFKGADLTHRDILGAIMHLNIQRDTVGDIVIGEKLAQVYVLESVAPVLERELLRIGKHPVQTELDTAPCIPIAQQFHPLEGTVASLRADAIVAFVTRLSREKAATLIRSGSVVCCHLEIESTSAPMEDGDVFSVRGYGKFRLSVSEGLTRKNRIHIIVYQYI